MWYLVCCKWWAIWKEYVSYDAEDELLLSEPSGDLDSDLERVDSSSLKYASSRHFSPLVSRTNVSYPPRIHLEG